MFTYLAAFKKLLEQLNGENLVLAGTAALLSHGLIMSRQPSDLDVVIFKPTDKQKEVLKTLSALAIKIPNQNDYPFEETKQFKFKKDDLILNILIEDKFTPVDLLYYHFGDLQFKVQNIAYNMRAKMSFRTIQNQFRYKDLVDLIDLKSSNFNLPKL